MQKTPSTPDIPLFDNLSGEEQEELREVMEPVSFGPGEKLIEEGRRDENLYVLASGVVEVYKRVLSRRDQHLATIEAPSVVGEMGLLTGPRAAATVVAKTEVKAHAIPRDRFLSMLDSGSFAAYKVVHELGRTLAGRMAKTDDSIAKIIAQLERANRDGSRDLNVFQDKLLEEWSF